MPGPRAILAAVGAALCLAATAAAAPSTQDVVLPGPVPYPTQSPPLVGRTAISGGFTRYVFHISSDQRIVVGVDGSGSPSSVRVRQRLDVGGRGDYQFGIAGPIEDVRRGPGSDSEPGLRADQLLWAGFSPGHKVLAADVTLQPGETARYLPLRLQLARTGTGSRSPPRTRRPRRSSSMPASRARPSSPRCSTAPGVLRLPASG